MFDTIEPQEQVTSIPFGRFAHLLQCAGWAFFIFGVIFRFANSFTIFAYMAWFAYFLMGFRQKCHFYSDRVKIKLTATQPIITPYSDIQDITLNKKKFNVLLKSGRRVSLDLTMDSKQRVEELRNTFISHLNTKEIDQSTSTNQNELKSQKES